MLTVETVLKVRLAKRDGQSVRQIAKKYRLSRNTVRKYVRGAEAVPHIPRDERISERVADEDTFLVADRVPGSAMLGEGILHRADHPAGVGTLQWTAGYDLARLLLFRLSGRSSGHACRPRFGPEQYVADCGGCQEDTQRSQHQGDVESTPASIRRCHLPYQSLQCLRGPAHRGLALPAANPNTILKSA